jgi:hypothetical protein
MSTVQVQKILLNVGNADQLAEAVAAISLKSSIIVTLEVRRFRSNEKSKCDSVKDISIHCNKLVF